MIAYVNGADIREAFSDIAPLKTDTVKFDVNENVLTLSAGSNALYVNDIDIIESSGLSAMTICVEYTDVSALIKSKDIVKIELSEFTVNLSTQNFHIVLPLSEAIIETEKPPSKMEALPITNTDTLNNALNSFRYISLFQKKLMVERPIQMCKNYAVILLPTVWLRVKSCDIEATLTKEQCSMITKFKPTHYLENDKLWFFKNNAALSIPIVAVDMVDEYLKILEPMNSIGIFNSKDLATKTKQLYQAMGVCECSVFVTKNNVFFRAQKATLELHDTVEGKVLYSFDTRLEYMESIFSMLGDDRQFEILYKDNVVCFRNSTLGIILSVGGK